MRLLPEKLADSAERWPEKTAIESAGSELTFSALRSRANSIAGWLCNSGIQPGYRVAILAEASCEYVVAYYGILTAGAAVVALNAAARADDLLGWIEHSGSKGLIIDCSHIEAKTVLHGLQSNFPVLAITDSPVDYSCAAFSDVISDKCSNVAKSAFNETALAALIYTSGTTGKPKAVMLDHGNLAANTDSIVQYFKLTSEDSIVNVLPFYYSFGNSILHTHIAAGARVIVERNLVYPHRIVERIASERVSGFAGVPSTYALLTSRVNFGDYDLSGLRYLAQAGGPMAPALSDRIRELLPDAKLYVMYGLTEASARVTYLPPEKLPEKRGSIGIPIPGVEIEIRDDHGKMAPAGVNGEIWVRGRNVMVGYWQDPEASSAVLVDGWLRTGDVGRADKDGFFYVEGRRSDIIKAGAHRVYPRDIEVVIESIQGIREVCVVGVSDEVLGQVIKACIVLEPDAQVSEMSVKSHCRRLLATYKVPKIVEFIPSLPKTASGKVQRSLL